MKHPNKVRPIFEEVKAYERKKAALEQCGISWVQPMQNSIILNGVPHSGTAAHVCAREKHRDDEQCRCKCGVMFMTTKS